MWWSSSALVSTAIPGASLSSERSDSSASTTSHSPAPQPAFDPGRADGAADEVAGVHPAAAQRVDEHARRRRLAVRAGDGDRRAQPGELAEQVRAVQLARRARGRARSGLSGGIALETTTSAPAGTLAAAWPTAGSIPAARSGAAVRRAGARGPSR